MKYGLFASAFSPFPHPGHIWAMYQAMTKGGCQAIVALLHVDPSKDRPEKIPPALSANDREIILKAMIPVAKIIPYETETELYRLYQIAKESFDCTIILGEEYRGRPFTGHDLDMPVFHTKRDPRWAGMLYVKRIADSYRAWLYPDSDEPYETHQHHHHPPTA